MIHPHIFIDINKLEEKTLEELQTTISDLTKKMNFISRSGNFQMTQQLMSAIESYKIAYQKKLEESMKKQNINTIVDVK